MTPGGLDLRLEWVLSSVALVVAMTVALVLPAGYFATTYHHLSLNAQHEAERSADALSQFAYLNPTSWQFQDLRLKDRLVQAHGWNSDIYQRLVDLRGTELFQLGEAPRGPVLERGADVADGLTVVGRVYVVKSLMPLIVATAWAALIGAVLGMCVYIALRTLPMRALRRVLEQLHASHESLREQVDAKERALAHAEEMSNAFCHLAMHDTLTGLPNRSAFQDRLNQMVAGAGARPLAVLIMGIDRFKEINDALGHEVGDQLLRDVARKLIAVLGEDSGVARLGGDEFSAVLQDVDQARVRDYTARVREALMVDVVTEAGPLSVEISIGVALYPEHGRSGPTLLQRADVAMCIAKRHQTKVAIYDPQHDHHSIDRLKLLAELPHAIARGALHLNYQPKLELATGRIAGAEALLRWRHSELGPVSPAIFIPLAEHTGYIREITYWLVDTVLAQLAAWHRAGWRIGIAVNLSAQNLHDGELVAHIRDCLTRYVVQPQWLTLEITESVMMADLGSSINNLLELDALGVRLSIDDFGTGYSSLAYLKKLPVRELKIDRSFIKDLATDAEDQLIVDAILDLASKLELDVVAEGVEDETAAEFLARRECPAAQGFFYYKPMPAQEFTQALAASAHGDVFAGTRAHSR